jgi:UDP-N-acetylglucosamine--N-acetylmuramyl-(pentapeptide) pyrophosphoryl-undecaprenol N-acetylglucosamine transferase
MGHFDPDLRVDTIYSGKLRRYHSLTLWQQLTNFRAIVLPNLRDLFFVGIGLIQSLVKLVVWRPDVVFTKGGFVCLPIGLAARMLHIPLVIHDSDAHPGLTNRMLAKWATVIGTGAPLKFYPYPISRSHYVGVPVGVDFQEPFGDERRAQVKEDLGFDAHRPLVVVTGGGLGARRINDAVALVLPRLLEHTNVILVSGEGQYDELRAITPQNDPHYQLHAFVSNGMAMMLGAADVVVARAGATTLLELAALAKPTILIPNGFLTGGHQLKNAAVYAEKGAVSIVDEVALEKNPDLLLDDILNILSDASRRQAMAHAFHSFAKPHAARDMANLVLSAVKR